MVRVATGVMDMTERRLNSYWQLPKMRTCKSTLQFAAVVFVLATYYVPSITQAQEATPAPKADPLSVEQQQVANRFQKLEELLLRSAELESAENPARAALLQQAAQLGKKAQLSELLVRAASSLDKKQYSQALDDQKTSRENLKRLLDLLQSENRGERVREQRDQVRRWIEETDRLLRLQKSLSGRTEGGQDMKQAAGDQDKLSDKAKDISQELGGKEEPKQGEESKEKTADPSASPKSSDTADDKAKDPNAPKDSEDKSSEDKSSEDKKSGESDADKKPGEEKPAEQKPSDSSDAKPSEADSPANEKNDQTKPGESEGDKPKDSKPQDGKPNEGQPKNDQPNDGQPKDGQPKDGKPSEGKSDDKPKNDPPKDGQSESQQSEGQSGDSGDQQDQQPEAEPKDPTERARKRIEQAKKKMEEAEQELKNDKRKEAVEKQRQAEEELRSAIEALEEILRQLREEEIERSLASLETRLRRMLEMQNKVFEETQRLQEITGEQATRQVEIRASNLALEEKKILGEGQRAFLLLSEEGSSAAFPEAMQQVNTDIGKIVERLTNADVGKLTVSIEQEIISSLEEMVAALVQVQKDKKEKKEKKNQPGQQQGEPGEQPLVDKLAELRLIRTLQVRINNRTTSLSQMLSDPADAVGQVTEADVLGEVKGLAERQASIRKVARDIVIGADE